MKRCPIDVLHARLCRGTVTGTAAAAGAAATAVGGTMPGAGPRIDVTDFMSRSTLGPTHVRVAVLCGICLLADGYDVGIFGAVVPSLIRDWHLSGTLAGLLGTASLAGMLVGAIVLGAAADRVGRKPTMIAALLAF